MYWLSSEMANHPFLLQLMLLLEDWVRIKISSLDGVNLMSFSDVEDVKFVINFDYPNSSEDYIHRIGRTGRSQRSGTAYAFFTANNARQARDLLSVLREANQVINPQLAELAAQQRGSYSGRDYQTVTGNF